MDIYTLEEGDLSLDVTNECGAVLRARYRGQDLLRPFSGNPDEPLTATAAGSFPMVPFCNRVEGNSFSFEGREYNLESNTDWDPLYLHGEGWISAWELRHRTETSLTMALVHGPEKGAPYGYEAEQTFSVDRECLKIGLNLKNTMDASLLFGLGHHMFFPKTPGTILKASARGFWTEKESFLPDQRTAVPEEMDFSSYAGIPGHWINNGFDGWDGLAEIRWPENNLGVSIRGGNPFTDYFVFNSDRSFEPEFQDDYFCFEPMTHTANGHKMGDGFGGLSVLAPGESLETALELIPMVIL